MKVTKEELFQIYHTKVKSIKFDMYGDIELILTEWDIIDMLISDINGFENLSLIRLEYPKMELRIKW